MAVNVGHSLARQPMSGSACEAECQNEIVQSSSWICCARAVLHTKFSGQQHSKRIPHYRYVGVSKSIVFATRAVKSVSAVLRLTSLRTDPSWKGPRPRIVQLESSARARVPLPS